MFSSISGQKQSDNIYYIYMMWLQQISLPKITIGVSILIDRGKQSVNSFKINLLKDLLMLNKPEVPGYWLTVYEETHLHARKVLQQIMFCPFGLQEAHYNLNKKQPWCDGNNTVRLSNTPWAAHFSLFLSTNVEQ